LINQTGSSVGGNKDGSKVGGKMIAGGNGGGAPGTSGFSGDGLLGTGEDLEETRTPSEDSGVDLALNGSSHLHRKMKFRQVIPITRRDAHALIPS
jgi:hypothetical protein